MIEQNHLERKREYHPREMIQFLHDGMRTSSLDVRIEEQRDKLGLGCDLSPTKRFSKAYSVGDTTHGHRYARCD
jgi:hypothetical protein